MKTRQGKTEALTAVDEVLWHEWVEALGVLGGQTLVEHVMPNTPQPQPHT
jgi:hypothetical protein